MLTAHAAYLAGIIDGEGYVNVRGKQVVIVNTDADLLLAVEAACDALGLHWFIRERSHRSRMGRKPIWELVISQRDTLERLHEAVTLHSAKRKALDALVASYAPRPPIAEVIRLRAEGLTHRAIAATLGVPVSNVAFWLARGKE